MRSILTLLLWLYIVSATVPTAAQHLRLFPYPNDIRMQQGYLQLDTAAPVQYRGLNATNRHYVDTLMQQLRLQLQAQVSVTQSPPASDLRWVWRLDTSLPTEGYHLRLSPRAITVSASTRTGFYYAYQTLRQLIPQATQQGHLPCVTIQDAPRFAYRGMMLDVSRHFSSVDFIKKQLDIMARYKLNTFHWHFTDGPAWRLQLATYPELTHYTAYRPYVNWKDFWQHGRRYCVADAPGAQGGYYTAEDVAEVLRYARERHIMVIPEIEMPGHSEEVLAVHPELSCSGKPYVNAEFCLGKDTTFRFLEGVLSEVLRLFPDAPYIHVGGDEAATSAWQQCPDCQRTMRTYHMQTEGQLQQRLMQHIATWLRQRGRTLIGWDEMADHTLPTGSVVMAWRGNAGAEKAVAAGHRAIITHAGYLYFDMVQDAPYKEPESAGGYTPLHRVYGFDPIWKGCTPAEQQLVWGVQANLWREYIATDSHTEHMLYPRLTALAEVAWTLPIHKDSARFAQDVLHEVSYLQQAGYTPFDQAKAVGERAAARTPHPSLSTHCAVHYLVPYSPYYKAGGDTALTDGYLGGWTHGDGRWQGTQAERIAYVVDLGKVRSFRTVSSAFYQSPSAYIWLPSTVTYAISSTSPTADFTPIGHFEQPTDTASAEMPIRYYTAQGQYRARYVRVTAQRHARSDSWTFTDELTILP